MLGALLPGAAHLQNIHPLLVHFPIAFLAGAAILYALSWGAGRESWSRTAFLLLVLGSVTALLAVTSGLYAQDGVMVAKSVREKLLSAHRQWMLLTLGLGIALTVWAAMAGGFPKKFRPLFVLGCLLMAAVMAKGADFGARMVFDYNAGGNACGQPIEFTK